MIIEPHEEKALREMVVYARAFAHLFPDRMGDKFAAKMRSYAQTIEDMLERVEPVKIDMEGK